MPVLSIIAKQGEVHSEVIGLHPLGVFIVLGLESSQEGLRLISVDSCNKMENLDRASRI